MGRRNLFGRSKASCIGDWPSRPVVVLGSRRKNKEALSLFLHAFTLIKWGYAAEGAGRTLTIQREVLEK